MGIPTNSKKKKKVLCVGLICLDIVNVCRDFPVEGTDQRAERTSYQKGGNAANTSAVLGVLGTSVDYFGVIPVNENDLFANQATEYVKKEMSSYNVGMDKIVYRESTNGIPWAVITINKKSGSRTIVAGPRSSTDTLDLDDLKKLDLSEYSWIHFEGRNEKKLPDLLEYVHDFNKTLPEEDRFIISLELEKPRRDCLVDIAHYADVLIVSQEMGEQFCKCTSACQAVEHMKTKVKPGAHIVVAWGSAGAAAGTAKKGDTAKMMRSYPPKEVLDTLGAGDTFNGAFIHAYGATRDLHGAVDFACKVAGCKVGSFGYDCLKNFPQDL